MALLKSRPRIRVLAPPTGFVGEPFRLEVVLECKRPLGIGGLTIELEGSEQIQRGEDWGSRRIGRWGARLCEARDLPAGPSSFKVAFELPADAPPTYAGKIVRVAYTATVHVDIPWWPDATRAFTIRVAEPARPAEGTARVVSTAPSGPRGKEPHLECSLASDVVALGGKLHGAVSFQNVAANRYRSLALTLVGREAVRTEGGLVVSRGGEHRFGTELVLPALREGESVPFALGVPKNLPPSHEARTWALRWALELRAPCGWNREVGATLPLIVAPLGSTAQAAPRAAPPSVGAARVLRLWTELALRTGMRLEDGALVKEVAGTVVRLRAEQRASGHVLVGELGFATLGLGLRGGPASVWQRLLADDLAPGRAGAASGVLVPLPQGKAWIGARDPGQRDALVTAVAPWLARAPLASIEDERIVLERRGAAQDTAVVGELARAALELAHGLAEARRAIPAPTLMAEHVPAWRKLAVELGSELELGRMAVLGRHEGLEARVVTEWHADGTPEATTVSLRAEPPLAEDHERTFRPEDGWSRPLEALPPAAQKLLRALGPNVLGVALGREWLELARPAPLAEPLAEVRLRLGELAAVARALGRADAGPYR
ncbi:MAG: hypothetical protein HY908_17300 [Myxococcales bacterium]|nr:hypothetical protein [Myxococcales bacterium]